MTRRNYTEKTIKLLGISSGDECAQPKCKNTLIEPATEKSEVCVKGHIAHIYAINEGGPRWKPDFPEEKLNSVENLIFLCRDHHGIVDQQPETYTADLLMKWKREHERKIKRRSQLQHFPTKLVDDKIKDEVDALRKSRFFPDFDRINSSLSIGQRLLKGELSCGTDSVRSHALAWCARILSYTEKFDKAEEYLKTAKKLGSCPEVDIANAFIVSQKGNKKEALSILAEINSPASRSAAFYIVSHHEDGKGAIDWLKSAGIKFMDLNSDGKFLLLRELIKLSYWECAEKSIRDISSQDLEEIPLLHYMVALTHLLVTVPKELRFSILDQLPFNLVDFSFASNTAAVNSLQVARRHFIQASKVAQEFNCAKSAKFFEEYELWIQLKNTETFNQGKERLQAKLRDPKQSLRFVRFALQFGVKLNLSAIKQEIEQQTALYGRMTRDVAFARLSCILNQETPEEIAKDVEQHYEELSEHIGKKFLNLLRIEIFAKAGLSEKANKCLDILLQEGLSNDEKNFLRGIIAEAQGTNLIESRKAQFEQTKTLNDLEILVRELEYRQEWVELCRYGEILFEKTDSIQNAELLSRALYKARDTQRLLRLLKANKSLLKQSRNLQMLYCESLYCEGMLLKARSELDKLNDDTDNSNYRMLKVKLAISLGDWSSLSTYINDEYAKKDQRSAKELIEVAELAVYLDSSRAKELVESTVSKGHNDADILATAYFLASKAGWENDKWLHRAIELSGSDGPLQTISLQDIVSQKPEWDRRNYKIQEALNHGEIPMYLAAQPLNKSLISLMLFPALVNPSSGDPRYKSLIPAYSAKYERVPLDIRKTFGIDTTVLLTLSFLNLLDKVLDAFGELYIPHSTFIWLFEEKQKAVFHQRSLITDAQQINHLHARNVLDKLVPSQVVDSDLSDMVGDELAMLITEAENNNNDDDKQHIVVRPSPVHRVSSLLDEEADLTKYNAVISSCLSIVDKLRTNGQLTTEKYEHTRAYLQLQEKPWPCQPEIIDGAVLYLDRLAVGYFTHLGILEKIKAAGFRLIVSPGTILDASKFISYENISEEIHEKIEQIRSVVSSRIESGKIKIGRQQNTREKSSASEYSDCMIEVFFLVENCDIIIADERFFNQHVHIKHGNTQVKICSTLDILDSLVSLKIITSEKRFEYKTLLRSAGYFFIPIDDAELVTYLNASTVKDNKVLETAELRAIRENILQIRMGDWIQLSQEAPWWDLTAKAFIRVLKSLWKVDADLDAVRVYSNWLVDQIDIRGWIHIFEKKNRDNLVTIGQGKQTQMLLISPPDVPQNIKDAYWNWLENRILGPIKEQYPDLYAWIIEQGKNQISKFANKDVDWNWLEDRISEPIKEQYSDLYTWIIKQKKNQISKFANPDSNEEK